MIERKDVMPLNYYKKLGFSGSHKGMRYLLRKSTETVVQDVENGEKEEKSVRPTRLAHRGVRRV